MSPPARSPLPRSLSRPLAGLWALLLIVVLGLLWAPGEAAASLENDRYDGNIFALYAGNGSLVPPRSSLAQSLDEHRVAVLVYYLDDSSVSKQFSPVVSELQRVWGNAVDLIPLVTDPLQNRPDGGVADPAHYWDGLIPQVVVIDGSGRVVFDRHGQVSVDAINTAVSDATGIPMAPGSGNSATLSFNELNSEVVASR
ncbi:thylakoid membrane photosystem I accumulation factor [Cyanobium sp. N.Huapi 1H5]|uniref:thylakoid membrane photosystem I accumulation factor n=1 Tax=Cyanobium sp. N.Huapi 1H5 TaxID=2823719 RepID=UPI0020CF9A10|nr:thylakoid membrane photosystem I accumulation factor [Cyanobium sp. N.Huapi 1H5]MCP9836642.1 thylakoid membrane photosystem I accumulation factor [Cyanobium sp. N.Huapi 1H5]